MKKLHYNYLQLLDSNHTGGLKMAKGKKIIEGYTSNQEVRSSMWVSEGKERVYQIACIIYENENLAKRIYGKNCYRRVRLIAEELGGGK